MERINDIFNRVNSIENIEFGSHEVFNLNSNGNIHANFLAEIKESIFAEGLKTESTYDVHINIVFNNCLFKGPFEFDCNKLLGTSIIRFKGCRFEDSVTISGSQRKIALSFESCFLSKQVVLSGVFSEIEIYNNKTNNLNGDIHFVQLNSNKLFIKEYVFESVSFEESNLRKISFLDSSIKKLDLDSATIGGIEVEETEVDQLISGEATTIESYFRIRSKTLKKINNIKIEKSKLSKDVLIEQINVLRFDFLPLSWDYIDTFKVRYCIIQALRIDHTKVKKNNLFSDFTATRVFNADRETFGFLKAQMENLNNKVDALFFSAYELKTLKDSLSWKTSLEDKLILTLNWESNRINTSPFRGVVFTFLVSQIFFIIYLATLDRWHFSIQFEKFTSYSINEYWTNFFQFFTVTHPLTFMSDYGINGWSYFVDIIGRIFIGYSIYQTVQAFRKYGKN